MELPDYLQPNNVLVTFNDRLAYTSSRQANGLDRCYYDVKRFHLAFGHPTQEKPISMQSQEVANKRADWIDSESQELRDAKTLVDQADAYMDIIYFAVGGLVELGVKPNGLW